MNELAQNWQFLILLFGFIALGWNITRSNRDMALKLGDMSLKIADMSLKVATKDDISRLENAIARIEQINRIAGIARALAI